MRVAIDYGRTSLTVDVDAERLVSLERSELSPLPNPTASVRDALESPLRYPALRRALTPDDRVTVLVDEHLPRLPELTAAVLEHIVSAGIDPSAITVLVSPSSLSHAWFAELPASLRGVQFEVHDPTERNRLAYLASTRKGRRIYLNRTAVEADQLVLLTGPRFDPLSGNSGAAGAIYPVLSDSATRQASDAAVTTEDASVVRREADEVFWLLGAPFLVQVIEGAGDTVVQVLGGAADTAADGLQWLDRSWRAKGDRTADVVVATLSGDPARQDVHDLACALACAARMIKDDGVIVLLTEAAPALGEGFLKMQQIEEPRAALKQLRHAPPADWPAAYLWLEAVRKARVFLLSGWPTETAEALFTTPVQHARQVQRLLDAGGTCLILPDAHKLLADLV
jgi:nickel-dependent lactate racemase